MLNLLPPFVPMISSAAGLNLTPANWHEINVSYAAFSLESLLLKPGLEALKKINNIKSYLNWPGTIVLNAAGLKANKEGYYTIISPFDGSKTRCSDEDLIEIITHIKPDAVLLPQQLAKKYVALEWNWSETIDVYLPFSLQERTSPELHGLYYVVDEQCDPTKCLSAIDNSPNFSFYVIGDIGKEVLEEFIARGNCTVEANSPANDATGGLVYARSGQINVLDPAMALQFETIELGCQCPTCSQQLTKAYLHHLLLHTPLLCQRFLIQHNVFWLQQ